MHTDIGTLPKQIAVAIGAALSRGMASQAGAAPTYADGTTAPLAASPPATFDLGTHLQSYIGATTNEGSGTLLDGTRVYFYDNLGSTDNPATALPFNLLVWQFASAKDSVRLYTHQDHLVGSADTDFEAQDVMEYSVFGCNGPVGGCKTAAEWTLLSDVTAFADVASGKPTYTFAGTDPTTIYRGGSAEFGALNAYTRDYTFATGYNFYGIRASTVSFLANDADPELDALVAFNRVDFPPPAIPEPETYAMLLAGLGALGAVARRRKQKARRARRRPSGSTAPPRRGFFMPRGLTTLLAQEARETQHGRGPAASRGGQVYLSRLLQPRPLTCLRFRRSACGPLRAGHVPS